MASDRHHQATGGVALEAAALRDQAALLEFEVRRLERHDWPGWLRNGEILTRRVSELRRQASTLEAEVRAVTG
jgi:hypothetical protein